MTRLEYSRPLSETDSRMMESVFANLRSLKEESVRAKKEVIDNNIRRNIYLETGYNIHLLLQLRKKRLVPFSIALLSSNGETFHEFSMNKIAIGLGEETFWTNAIDIADATDTSAETVLFNLNPTRKHYEPVTNTVLRTREEIRKVVSQIRNTENSNERLGELERLKLHLAGRILYFRNSPDLDTSIIVKKEMGNTEVVSKIKVAETPSIIFPSSPAIDDFITSYGGYDEDLTIQANI